MRPVECRASAPNLHRRDGRGGEIPADVSALRCIVALPGFETCGVLSVLPPAMKSIPYLQRAIIALGLATTVANATEASPGVPIPPLDSKGMFTRAKA